MSIAQRAQDAVLAFRDSAECGAPGEGQIGDGAKLPHIPFPYVRAALTVRTGLDAPILNSEQKLYV